MNEKYTITLNKEQLRLIADCVEDCHRFAAGDLELANMMPILLCQYDDVCRKESVINYHLGEIKKLIYPDMPINSSHVRFVSGDSTLLGNRRKLAKCVFITHLKERQFRND